MRLVVCSKLTNETISVSIYFPQDIAGSPIDQAVRGAAGIAPIEVGHKSVKQPAPAPEGSREDGVTTSMADPGAAKEEANAS